MLDVYNKAGRRVGHSDSDELTLDVPDGKYPKGAFTGVVTKASGQTKRFDFPALTVGVDAKADEPAPEVDEPTPKSKPAPKPRAKRRTSTTTKKSSK